MKPPEPNPPSDLHSHIGFWLRYVSNHVSHAFAQKLLHSGVTVAEWVILREMFDRDGRRRAISAEITGLTRGPSPNSPTAYREAATSPAPCQGRPSLPEPWRLPRPPAAWSQPSRRIADENDEEFFAALSPKQRKRLVTTLRKLAQANHLSTLPTE